MNNTTKQCSKCGKQFLIITQEQEFLKEKRLPLPDNCPTCRQMRRLTLRGGERMLYKTQCQQCGKDIIVAKNPATVKNPIYCKKDYEDYFLSNDPIINDPLPEV